jgi:hypothetical protein
MSTTDSTNAAIDAANAKIDAANAVIGSSPENDEIDEANKVTDAANAQIDAANADPVEAGQVSVDSQAEFDAKVDEAVAES